MSDKSEGRSGGRHPIGVVSRRTGLKQDLIRAWERRYGAVEPSRSDTNRRYYSDADVERLNLLRRAVEMGRSISQVAELPDDELAALVAEDVAASAEAPSLQPPRGGGEPRVEPLLEASLEAVRRLDAPGLEEILQRASVGLGRTALLERLLAPFLERIGDLWNEGELRPVHEHLATAAVRSLAGILQQSQPPASSGAPHLLVTTPARQLHELGALMAAATASAHGWRVTYLGPNLPAEEIAAAARQTGARAVVLSITYPPDDLHMAEELRRLQRLLEGRGVLLVGGRAAKGYGHALEGEAVHRVADLKELRQVLERLRQG